MEWDIGSKAREIDSKTLKERLKLEKNSVKKIIFAFFLYFIMMLIFTLLI